MPPTAADVHVSYVLSPEFAYATLSDRGVAIYAQETGDTHFVAGVAGLGLWAPHQHIEGDALLEALREVSPHPTAEIRQLIRLGILIPTSPCD